MIRQAEEKDISRIVEMAHRLASESTYSHIEISPERIAITAITLITHGFARVVEIDGKVVGGLLADIHTPWYSFDKLAIDFSLYIEPEHRNGLIAARLIKQFEAWAISMGAKQLRPGIGTGDNGAERLYLGLGYKKAGSWFVKNI